MVFKRKKSTKLVLQTNETDCAVACILMIANRFNCDISAQAVRKYSKTTYSGTSIYGILQALSASGIKAEAQKGSLRSLFDDLSCGELYTPFIALLNKKDGLDHFVVIEKKNGYLIVLDPDKGKYKLNYNDFADEWSGYIVKIEHAETFVSKSTYDHNPCHSVIKYIKPEMISIIAISFLSAIMAIAGIISGFSLQLIVENVPTNGIQSPSYSPNSVTSTAAHQHSLTSLITDLHSATGQCHSLIVICGILIIISVIHLLMTWIRGILVINLKNRISQNMVNDYLYSLFALKYDYYKSFLPGEFIQRYEDIQDIPDIIAQVSAIVMLDFATFLISAATLFSMSTILSLGILGILLTVLFGIAIFNKRIYKENKLLSEANAQLNNSIVELLNGFECIKNNGLTDWLLDCNSYKFSTVMDCEKRLGRIALHESTTISGVVSLGLPFILMLSGLLISLGQMTVGEMLSFYSISTFLFNPVEKIMEMHPLIEKVKITIKKMEDVINGSKDNVLPTQYTDHSGGFGISLNQVTYSYDYTSTILHNINLSIEAEECLGIVGKSGCGKSTLGRVLAGLIIPENGEVHYISKNKELISCDVARSSTGYVSQAPVFFEGSVLDNLKGGNDNISYDEVKTACSLVGIDEDIESMPLQYKTILFSNASNISLGQRQRLSIARAILRKPRLIVLDEITSNLDAQSKNAIKNTIQVLKKHMTCIIITHDRELIDVCDRCIDLNFVNKE